VGFSEGRKEYTYDEVYEGEAEDGVVTPQIGVRYPRSQQWCEITAAAPQPHIGGGGGRVGPRESLKVHHKVGGQPAQAHTHTASAR